jgi:hypothetical protein
VPLLPAAEEAEDPLIVGWWSMLLLPITLLIAEHEEDHARILANHPRDHPIDRPIGRRGSGFALPYWRAWQLTVGCGNCSFRLPPRAQIDLMQRSLRAAPTLRRAR